MIRLATLALALSLSACSQGVGDRCQLNSDCQGGLLCVLPPGNTANEGGKCESTTDSGVVTIPNDFSAVADFTTATTTDSAVSNVDLGEVD